MGTGAGGGPGVERGRRQVIHAIAVPVMANEEHHPERVQETLALRLCSSARNIRTKNGLLTKKAETSSNSATNELFNKYLPR